MKSAWINGGRHATPITARIDLHYAEMALVARWDLRRVDRLCAFLRLGRHELASLLMITHKRMDACIRRNRWDGPAVLLMTLLEAEVLKDYVPEGELVGNPMAGAMGKAEPCSTRTS